MCTNYKKQNQQVIMSDINSSLIGFLKKKSLFSTSPDKSTKLRERSKDKREAFNSSRTPRNTQDKSNGFYETKSSHQLKKNTSQRVIQPAVHSEVGHESLEMMESPIRYQQGLFQSEARPVKRNFNFKNPEDPAKKKPKQEEQKVTSLWTGLVNYSTTFESARLQSAQCLDNLSVKIQTEVSNINYKIDVFHSKMTKILNNEFASLQEKIYTIVNKVFEQSERNIKHYIKQQEEILAAELLSTRSDLLRQFQKIQIMREEINKPHWKKVAGQLLSSDLEAKVQEMLVKSRSIDVRHWQMGDLGASKVVLLEQQLRDMVRLHAI